MSLKSRVTNSSFAKAFFKWKFYTDLGTQNVSWIVDKWPVLVSAGVTLSWLGVTVSKPLMATIVIGGFLSIGLIGWTLKVSGLFDVEKYIVANINPVERTVLEAAKKINERYK